MPPGEYLAWVLKSGCRSLSWLLDDLQVDGAWPLLLLLTLGCSGLEKSWWLMDPEDTLRGYLTVHGILSLASKGVFHKT